MPFYGLQLHKNYNTILIKLFTLLDLPKILQSNQDSKGTKEFKEIMWTFDTIEPSVMQLLTTPEFQENIYIKLSYTC